jgi:hypothetical protein
MNPTLPPGGPRANLLRPRCANCDCAGVCRKLQMHSERQAAKAKLTLTLCPAQPMISAPARAAVSLPMASM